MLGSLLVFAILLFFIYSISSTYGVSPNSARGRAFISTSGPIMNDSSHNIEKILQGFKFPTGMAFLSPNDILVSEKDGTVQRVINGHLLSQPLLRLNVDRTDERGLLGIAVSKNESKGVTYVFVYYTEFKPTYHSKGITLGNRLYRYQLSGNTLVNPKLLLDLQVKPGPSHVGGKLRIGPDGNLYLTVGDMEGSFNLTEFETKAQNYQNGTVPDGRAGILRITQDGEPVNYGILGNVSKAHQYSQRCI